MRRKSGRRIERVSGGDQLVQIWRRKRWERMTGWVVADSPKWVLLASMFDHGFDGFTALRTADVSKVETRPSTFTRRVLAAEGYWPLPTLGLVDLHTTRSTIRTLGALAPLVTVHYEDDHPGECLVGVPHHFRRKTFDLRTVDTEGKWDPPDSVFRYRTVSRVDVFTAYSNRLAAFGDLGSGTYGPGPRSPVGFDG